mmetsp:Transcript_72177/g.145209  ORF Transcript_72177/g.145209 Transcript_72177/m.145209 type:complete len:861 (-) Transcript_72177:435-3017(-)|eukprot:CAMPEP_0171721272 /NCGR_PEP_ID=MMETSP0991-20121206/22282_1 /TAXON_ID=483369 /ORGANISM="non described non described, Strain CCMP2098" /LENGTH=860 /DNA_ID=CAMNT_0012313153 /DNA_START=26 /DNA_END=2608 /DNA_ORIENTATION=-
MFGSRHMEASVFLLLATLRGISADEDDDKFTSICEENGGGVFLPLHDIKGSERGSPLPIFGYFCGMIWCFLGVGIIADVFMGAIEVITSKEVEVVLSDGTKTRAKVWNATVANLTLMALGSSAPEIILSVIETLSLEFYAGDLGPSTIVGSAAFNLLVIIGVCVVAIPPGDDPNNPDGRKIADLSVFSVTCSWGLFAYVWLIIILVFGPTPDSVSFYEGLITFLYFPITVVMAYAADQGFFNKLCGGTKVTPAERVVSVGGEKFSEGDAAKILMKLDNSGMEMSNEEKAKLMVAMSNSNKPSRAALRMQATRMMTGGKRVVAPKPRGSLLGKYTSASKSHPQFFFGDSDGGVCTKYAILESNPLLTIHVMRVPAKGPATIKYKTEDVPGGATAGDDYIAVEGTLTFADGESTKDVNITVCDDEAVEDDEQFLFKIFDCSDPLAELNGGGKCEITIVDDDEPGEVGFSAELESIILKESTGKYQLKVNRFNGSSGDITVKYRTEHKVLKTTPAGEKRAAEPGTDFEATSGSVHFGPGEIEKVIPLYIIDDKITEPKQVCFDVQLFDCQGPVERAGLAQRTTCEILVVDDENTKAIMDLAKKFQQEQDDKYAVGTASWGQQFADAFEIECEEGEDPGAVTKIMHYVTLPWKLFFAICPPTSIGDGWLCFGCALMLIGLVTAFIGDLAALFGCSIGVPDSITAITFVALGTSLPDTFASKAAALSDDTADAAVGNVTGSNAVNVFLGLGVPWLMAAMYWDFEMYDDATKLEWIETYMDSDSAYLKDRAKNGNPCFAVPSGTLGPSVLIFVGCASTCIATLVWRRQKVGMELGGPQPLANQTGAFFVSLWFVYVIGSIIVYVTQ